MSQDRNNNDLQLMLEQGCKKSGITSAKALPSFLQYIELLVKWNKTYNLTAIKEPEAMLNRHVLDSLSVHTFIEGKDCLDIGTGPGLPGMILALALPDTSWILLDSNQKKVRFLRHVKAELDVSNVEIIQSRVESYKPEKNFNTIICRAFAPLNRMLELSRHLITQDNQLLAMKGQQAKDEIDELKDRSFLIQLNTPEHSTDTSPTNLIQVKRAR